MLASSLVSRAIDSFAHAALRRAWHGSRGTGDRNILAHLLPGAILRR